MEPHRDGLPRPGRGSERARPRLKSISREISSVEHALRIIGNKGTEQELLGVLEDLTILKAETEG